MKKKRKIQIPAAAYGIGTNYETQLFGTDYAGLLKQQGDAYTRMNNFQLGMANKDLNAATNFTESLNANDNQFFSDLKGKYGNAGKSVGSTGNPVIDKAGAIGEATFNAIGGLMDQFGTKSTATTGKQATMQSITDIGTQAANGYNIGKHFGGIGAAIGAGAGAIVGLVGRSGLKASMTSFTDYDEGTLGTGLIGAFGNKGLRKERARIKQNAYNNRAAVQGTNYLQNEAYDDLLGMNASASAYGGVPTSMFFGDAGEWMRTEDGEFHKIPEDHSKTDSKLIQADGKVQVLSDALKVGGKTPAKWFDNMATTKKSKFNDIYALNAAKLNKMNNNMIFDLLFALQETVKQLKGIKPKTKQLIPAAAGGDTVGEDSQTKDIYRKGDKPRLVFVPNTGYKSVSRLYVYPDRFEPRKPKVQSTPSRPALTVTAHNYNVSPGLGDRVVSGVYNPNREWGSDAQWYSGNNQWYNIPTTNVTDITASNVSTSGSGVDKRKTVVSKPTTEAVTTQQVVAPEVETVYDESELNYRPDLQPVMGYTPTIKKPTAAAGDDNDTGRGRGFDWGSLASRAASLAPILSNLMATPETVLPNYNPYETAILNTMRRRRYDVSSAIEDLNRNRAISNYNASQFNTSTGANLAYRLQSAVNTDRAIANLRTMENNYNNQYLGDYANMANNLGQQRTAADNLNDDLNAQNRAAAGNMVSTAKGQLSGWAQNNYLMDKLSQRDSEMLSLYRRLFEAGSTWDDYRDLMENNTRHIRKKNKKGGNKNGSKLV